MISWREPFAALVGALEDASQCSVLIGIEHEFNLKPLTAAGVSRDNYLEALRGVGKFVTAERMDWQVEFRGSPYRDVLAAIEEHRCIVAMMRETAARIGLQLSPLCESDLPVSLQISCSLWRGRSNAFVSGDVLDLSPSSPLARSLEGLVSSYAVHRKVYCCAAKICSRRSGGSRDSLLFVPRYNTWGVNNRAAAYRVCYSQAAPQDTRIENRVACSSASVSHCLQSTLASMLAGWSESEVRDLNESRMFGFSEPLRDSCSYALL